MRVEVISATEHPVEVVSRAAGTCYGRGDVNSISKKRIETCFYSDHMSVFEHASVTVRIEGVSRACMAQLTRHRLCSFCVESQRYNKYDLNGNDWYVTPPAFEGDAAFGHFMEFVATFYKAALMDGNKPEDARFVLPEAMKTNLVMTCNLRQLFHLFDMRRSQAAQWEIRQLCDAVADAVSNLGKEWAFMIGLWG